LVIIGFETRSLLCYLFLSFLPFPHVFLPFFWVSSLSKYAVCMNCLPFRSPASSWRDSDRRRPPHFQGRWVSLRFALKREGERVVSLRWMTIYEVSPPRSVKCLISSCWRRHIPCPGLFYRNFKPMLTVPRVYDPNGHESIEDQNAWDTSRR
jgi:hypothetical protein